MNENEVVQALDEAIKEKQRNKDFVKSVGPAIVEMLKPTLEAHTEAVKAGMQQVADGVAQIKIDVPKISVPEASVNVKIPEIRVPEAKVTVSTPPIDTKGLERAISEGLKAFKLPEPRVTVNIPETKIPNFPEIPPTVFPSLMNVLLSGIDRKNPLPVMMVDLNGNPYFPSSGGGQGGGSRIIGDITDSRGISLIDAITNPAQPQLRTSASVTFPSGSLATALVDSSGVAYSGSNPLPTTGSATLSAATGQGDAASALRMVVAGNSDMSVVVNSGTLTAVTNITNSLQTALVDSSGVQYSGSNPLPTTASLSVPQGQGDSATAMRVVIAGNSDASVVVNNLFSAIGGSGEANANALRVINASDGVTSVVVNSGTLTAVTAVTNITNSIQTALIDSSGVQYSGSNPLPTTATLSTPQGQGDAATAMRVIIAGNSDASVTATQTGTWNIGTVTTLTGVTNSIQSALIDSTGVQYSGSNPVPITGNIGTITTVTGVTNSLQSALIDSTGVQYSGSNPVPTIGSKINNNAAPGATNVGILPAVANAAAQSWTEGNQVALSTDLTGQLRVTGSLSVGGTTDNSAFTAGTSTGTPAMGFYHSVVDTVTDGRAAAVGLTSKRAMMVGLFDANGNPVFGATPLPVTVINTPDTTPVPTPIAGETGDLVNVTSNALDVNVKNFPVFNLTQVNNVPVTPPNAQNVSGTGLLSVGNMAQVNEISPTKVTEALFGGLRISPNRNLYNTIRDGAGNERGANVSEVGNLNTQDNKAASELEIQTPILQAILDAISALPQLQSTLDNNSRTVNVLGTTADKIQTANITITSSTAETTLFIAPPGQFAHLRSIVFTNTSASTVCRIDLKSATGATTVHTFQSVGGAASTGIALGGAIIIPQTTRGATWTITCGTSTADIRVSATFEIA